MNDKNKKVEELLEKMKATEGREQHLKEFMELLKETVVLVPAVMPKNTPPAVMKKMLENPGKPQAIPEGAKPTPCILENEKKEKLLAAFTSAQQMNNQPLTAPKFPLVLNMPFNACMDFVKKNSVVSGIVINPYSHNVILRVEKKQVEQTQRKVTLEEFHVIARNRFEFRLLPERIEKGKKEVVERLCTEQGDYLRQLYEEVYTTEVACPYTPEDFECMTLNISDELLLLQITMPAKYLLKNTCASVIVAYDRVQEKTWYYTISLEKDGRQLKEVYDGGNGIRVIGDAPVEGNELNTVLDLIQ